MTPAGASESSPLPTSDNAEPCPSKALGRLLVLLAALLWSTSGLFAKAPLFADWPEDIRGILLGFWRAGVVALVLIPGVRSPRWNVWLIPLCLCFAGMNVSYLTGMSLTTAANTIWLQNLAPSWVFLYTLLLFREPIAREDYIPLVLGLFGVGVILAFEIHGQDRLGVAAGIFSGMTYAGVIVFMRRLRTENTVYLVFLCHAFSAAIVFPLFLYYGIWPTPVQLAVLFAFGIVQTGIPYVLFATALRHIPGQEAVAIGLLEPVVLPLWVYLVWGELAAPWTLVGAGFILTGLVARYVVVEAIRLHDRRQTVEYPIES